MTPPAHDLPTPSRSRPPRSGPLASGWLPFLVVVLLASWLAHRGAHVRYVDLLLFGGYVLGWLTLPGTLCWRWATARRGPRPLAEDLAIGTLVGYVVEFPVYLLALAAGAPRAYLAWPVVVLAVSLSLPGGRRLWRSSGERVPLWWSWSVAGGLGCVAAWLAHDVWGPFALDEAHLTRPQVDEPYHLALAAGLQHHFPAEVLYVDDTPLKYHWLSHLHVAASGSVTGTDLVVLLRSLCIPVLVLLVLLAAAHAVVRLSGARWTGLVLLAGLLVAPIAFTGWDPGSSESLLAVRLLISPSAGFVNAALLVGVLLCVEILGGRLSGAGPWLLVTLSFVAMLGAKSTSLAVLIGGLLVAAAVASLAARRLDRVAAGLAACAVLAFVVGTPFFFGAGSHGLSVDPFEHALTGSGLPRWTGPLAAVYLLGYLSTGAGLLGLLLRGGWRRPDRLFLVMTCAAGLAASEVFHQQAGSEYYFAYVVLLPMLLGGVLGLHALLERTDLRHALAPSLAVYALAALAGTILLALVSPLTPAMLHGSALRRVLEYRVVPVLVVLALAVATALAVRLALRFEGRFEGRFEDRRTAPATALAALTPPLLVLALAGLGTAPTLRALPGWWHDPWQHDAPARGRIIGDGGIEAARWLRDHSDVDTLVATNAHCLLPHQVPCSARSFWMAGYSERQFLVEGWSYVAWDSVGKTSPTPDDIRTGPFWDPVRLRDNDAAFTAPSPATLDRLRERGVRWLLVDRRYGADLPGLRRYAEERFQRGAYTVFALPRAPS